MDNRLNNFLSVLFFAFVFVYLFFRALYVDLTHDEALSAELVSGTGGGFYTANNHLLNSLLTKILTTVFGRAEIVLRLPGLFGFVLFYIYGQKLLNGTPWVIRWFLLMLLVLNHYFLEFFALNRGYGLSMGLIIVSFYYLKRFCSGFQEKKFIIKDLHTAVFLCLLAATDNLTLLNVVFSYFIVLLILFSFNLKVLIRELIFGYEKFKVFILFLLWTSGLISWIIFLQMRKELYFGGSIDFIHDTLTVLIHRFFGMNYYGETLWKILLLLTVLFILGVAIVLIIRRKNRFYPISTTLLVYILILNIQFYFLESKLPLERTALIFYILFPLCFSELIGDVWRKAKDNSLKYLSVLIVIPAFFIIINFGNSMNLVRSTEWRYDMNSGEVLSSVSQIIIGNSSNTDIFVDHRYYPSLRYYNQELDLGLKLHDTMEEANICSAMIRTPDVFIPEGFIELPLNYEYEGKIYMKLK